MHVEHQLRGLFERVAEELLQHVRDVAHQVHRVVPHDHDPRVIRCHQLVLLGFVDPRRFERRRHAPSVPPPRARMGGEPPDLYDGIAMSVGSRPLVPSRLAPGGIVHGGGDIATSKIGSYIALTKPRIIELLLITTVPTMVLAHDGWPSTWLVIVTLIGGTLAAGGANAINMYVDRDIDRLMVR